MLPSTFRQPGSTSAGRLGEFRTPRGTVRTPVFMPVGTQGTVKATTPDELLSAGAQILLANTYHLFLRPGHERIRRLGGLHRFMGWERPILTDSGGYQIFSLADLRRRFTEEGVLFQSHLDGGARHLITPELAVEIQETLGSDIMMVLDECTPYPADTQTARASMELSLRWAGRCLAARTAAGALFGIVQGGMHPGLRREYIKRIQEIGLEPRDSKLRTAASSHETRDARLQTNKKPTEENGVLSLASRVSRLAFDFDGFAIGGLSVGEPTALMYEMVEVCTERLPRDRPRYLMGVGTPENIVECIDRGVDMFDCVIPTRHARNGTLFTWRGDLHIENARFADDATPPDEDCSCLACRRFSRAYLRHLFLAREILASRLATLHNLQFYFDLVERAALALAEGNYLGFKRKFLEQRKELL